MHDHFDDLLAEGLYAPPDDFKNRILARIGELPEPEYPQPVIRRKAHRGSESLQWLAIIGASLFGGSQLFLFMFGIWTATSAG